MSRIAVVGAGIAGVSTAYFLKKKGYDVTVFDLKSGVAQGATSISAPVLPMTQGTSISMDIIHRAKAPFCPVKIIEGLDKGDTKSLGAFIDAFGWDYLKTFLPSRLVGTDQKLSILTSHNYNLVLNLLHDLPNTLPVNFGFLKFSQSSKGKGSLEIQGELFSGLVDGYAPELVDGTDCSRMIPSLQNKALSVNGGLFEPLTGILNPVEFTHILANESNATFRFEEGVQRLECNENNEITHIITTKGDRLPFDKVVLCNSYGAQALTQTTNTQGDALISLIPIRSFKVDVSDTTPNHMPLPLLFPTKPLTFLAPVVKPDTPIEERPSPEDIITHTDMRVPGSGGLITQIPNIQENVMSREKSVANRASSAALDAVAANKSVIVSTDTPFVSTHPENRDAPALNRTLNNQVGLLYQPSAMFVSELNTVFAADPLNPRKFSAYIGGDMTELKDELPGHHMKPFLAYLEQMRKIPRGAYINTTLEEDFGKKRPQDGAQAGARRFLVAPDKMALHSVGSDGVPVIGQTPTVKNLYINVGHGQNPFSTAVIGGQMIASIVDNKTSIPLQSIPDLAITLEDYSPQRFTPAQPKQPWFAK